MSTDPCTLFNTESFSSLKPTFLRPRLPLPQAVEHLAGFWAAAPSEPCQGDEDSLSERMNKTHFGPAAQPHTVLLAPRRSVTEHIRSLPVSRLLGSGAEDVLTPDPHDMLQLTQRMLSLRPVKARQYHMSRPCGYLAGQMQVSGSGRTGSGCKAGPGSSSTLPSQGSTARMPASVSQPWDVVGEKVERLASELRLTGFLGRIKKQQ